MKQTNNAIKFLMAQYRAIFKSAYIKGLATAIVLTSSLTAGQAQAAAWDFAGANGSSGDITITGSGSDDGTDGKWQNIGITITNTNNTLSSSANITISGGTDDNKITTDSTDATVSGDVTFNALTINSGAALNISADATSGSNVSATLTTNFTDVTVEGTLNLDTKKNAGGDGKLIFNANTLKISGTGSTVQIGSASTATTTATISLGSEDSAIQELTIENGGALTMTSGDKVTTNIYADILNVNAGSTLTTAGTNNATIGTMTVAGEVNTADTTIINADTLSVVENGTLTTGGTTKINTDNMSVANGGTFVASGATVTLQADADNNPGTATFTAGSTVDVKDNLTFIGGTTTIEADASLSTSTTGTSGALTVGDGTADTTLKIDSAVLGTFLESANGKGAVDLKSGSVLEFSDPSAVDLASFTWTSGGAAAKKINAVTGSLVKGTNLSVSKALGTDAGKLAIEADTLTLGDTAAKVDGFGFASAEAKNLTFLGTDTSTPVLKEDVTLTSTKSVTGSDGKPVDVTDDGKIVGDVILGADGKGLIVNGGNYTADGTITVSGGSLKVTASDKPEVDSTLTLTGTLKINAVANSAVTVSGGNAVLDITNTKDIAVTEGNTTAKVTAQDEGVLLATSTQVNKLLAGTAQSGASVVLNNGTLEVSGDMTLAGTKLTGTAAADRSIVFDGSNGGTLNVTGALTLTGDKVEITTTGPANVTADTLTLDGTAADFTIGAGNYSVKSGLAAAGSVTDVKVTGTVNLGNITTDEKNVYTADTTGGTVGTDLTVATGTLNVNAGEWSAENLTVSAGSAKVGSDAPALDKDGNQIIASLSGKKLSVGATGAKFIVNKGNSATFKEIEATDANTGLASVFGTMTVSGKVTQAPAGEEPEQGKFKPGDDGYMGFGLTNGTINVSGIDGKFVIGSTAAAGMLETDAKKAETNYVYDNFGKYNLTQGGTLVLDFQSGSFTLAQLQQISKELSGSKDTIDGLISIGNATISNITGEGGIVKEDANGNYYASWEDYSKYQSALGAIADNTLLQTRIEGVDSSSFVGNVGSVVLDSSSSFAQVKISGNTSFNQAYNGNFVANSNGATAGANVTAGTLTLRGDGAIGKVTLADETALALTEGNAKISEITGYGEVELGATSNTTVTGDADAVKFTTAAGSTLDIKGDLKATDKLKLSVFDGNLNVGGKATFSSLATFAGNNKFAGDLNFADNAVFKQGATEAKNIYVAAAAGEPGIIDIADNAQVSAEVIASKTGTDSIKINVGTEAGNNAKTDSTGYLTVGRLDLNGGELLVDPNYNQNAAVVAINTLGDEYAVVSEDGNAAGVLNGTIAALRNSIVAIGVKDSEQSKAIDDLKATFAKYQEADGSLQQEGVGSIVYVAQALDVDAGSKLVVASDKTFSSYDKAVNATATVNKPNNFADNDVYIASNSVLAISDDAALNSFETVSANTKATTSSQVQRAAINFEKNGASLYAEKGAKVILVGDGFNTRSNIFLFSDQDEGDQKGIEIKGNELTVETMNGLLFFTYKAGETTTAKTLDLNRTKIDGAFEQTSAPVKNTLISYVASDNNWENYGEDGYKEDTMHGDLAKNVETTNGQTFTDKEGNVLDRNEYVAIAYEDAEGKTAYRVYEKSYNYFLDAVAIADGSGIEAETAARLGVFGGSVQAAMTAGSATTDAIAGRFGMGAQASGMTYADNGQGAGLWVTPIYRNADSDGFAAQGVSYGTDLNLYGVALGADYTLANGLRVGAMFNVGSGDADGQGAGSLATNDFDYYGFAAFAGYTMGQFSIVGDISYTTVDNEVTANTAFDKIGANFDTTNLSVGVTGQYALNLNGTMVTPHAGLRFSSIDLDDYTVDGKDVIAAYNGDTMNVFSIPVGVTIAKEFEGETWTVKPSFDLTLTGQFGDDEAEGTVEWAGINNHSTSVTSEVFDNFTYGATVGVAAKTGNFSLGFGLNYTGSSNVDEFGVNANARYVF